MMKGIAPKLLMSALIAIMALSVALPLAQAKEADSGQWRFQLAPYIWMAGQKGNVATLPGLPAADIEVDFYDDILGNLNGALMLVGEARKDRFGIVADIAYTDIESENSTPGPFFSHVNSRTKSWMISAALFYRLAEKKRAFLDLMGGARYWSLDSELTLEQGLVGQRQISHTENWVDPLVGLKGLLPLGDSNFYIGGVVMIGGFGVGSDFMYDLTANLGYQWTKGFTTTIGYRYLGVDYEKGGFKYDVTQQGPVIGFSWSF
jgi:hypothetical protein